MYFGKYLKLCFYKKKKKHLAPEDIKTPNKSKIIIPLDKTTYDYEAVTVRQSSIFVIVL